MDLFKLPNPYDFANPVNDPQLFVGREPEIGEIRYYLDHASKAFRPITRCSRFLILLFLKCL